MFDRNHIQLSYCYGFNGKEADHEGIGGGGLTYDYGFRIYNPSIARFLSVDPLSGSYPWYTPYQFAGNKPIECIDVDGLEEMDYNKFMAGMVSGAQALENITFREVGVKHTTKNNHWVSQGATMIMHPNSTPAAAMQDLIDNPGQYKIGCAEFAQLTILFGKLNALKADGFNEYILKEGKGKFMFSGLASDAKTDRTNGNEIWATIYKKPKPNVDGKEVWVDERKLLKMKTYQKRSIYSLKGETKFNALKAVKGVHIGSSIYLDNLETKKDNIAIILLLVFSNSMFSQVSSIRIGRDKVILEKVKGNEINIDTIKIKKVWFGSDYFYYKDLKIHLEKVDNGDFRDSLTSYVKKIILPPIKRSRFTSRVM